jgi:hypothetical protein
VLAHPHSPPGERRTGQPAVEVADIVRAHRQAFARVHALTAEQSAVLDAIARCRTGALGGHLDVCDTCGNSEISYNSCRNRHCPKCQSLAQARWLERRMQRVLPTHAFHVVFTLPSELRPVALANRTLLFDLLFACAAETLLELGRDPRWLGAELGITSVLHTWTRELLFHPHVHCIVTGGGLSLDGQHWICTRKNFLLPVRVLGALFRGKFLAGLRHAYARGELRLPATFTAHCFDRLCNQLHRKRWVVYSKPPFGGPEHVFRYLGRYTHRVGLSNHRLLSFDSRGVTFRTRGTNLVTLPPIEFLRRFLLHVLPKRFVKIRHHGLMAASNVSSRLQKARHLLEQAPTIPTAPVHDFRDILLVLTGVDLRRCPLCLLGTVVRHPLVYVPAPPHPPDTS